MRVEEKSVKMLIKYVYIAVKFHVRKFLVVPKKKLEGAEYLSHFQLF